MRFRFQELSVRAIDIAQAVAMIVSGAVLITFPPAVAVASILAVRTLSAKCDTFSEATLMGLGVFSSIEILMKAPKHVKAFSQLSSLATQIIRIAILGRR